MKRLKLFGNGESNSLKELEISHAKLEAVMEAEEGEQTKGVRIKTYAYELAAEWCELNGETISSFMTKAVVKEVMNKIKEEIENKKQLYAMAPRPRILEVAQEIAVYNKDDKALD